MRSLLLLTDDRWDQGCVGSTATASVARHRACRTGLSAATARRAAWSALVCDGREPPRARIGERPGPGRRRLAVQAPLPHQRVALAGGSGALTVEDQPTLEAAALVAKQQRQAIPGVALRADMQHAVVGAGAHHQQRQRLPEALGHLRRLRPPFRRLLRAGRKRHIHALHSLQPLDHPVVHVAGARLEHHRERRRQVALQHLLMEGGALRLLVLLQGAWIQPDQVRPLLGVGIARLDDAGGRRGTERVVLAAGTVNGHTAGDDRRVPVPAVAELHPLVERVALPSKPLTGHLSSDPARGGSWDLREVLAGMLGSPAVRVGPTSPHTRSVGALEAGPVSPALRTKSDDAWQQTVGWDRLGRAARRTKLGPPDRWRATPDGRQLGGSDGSWLARR